jgi:hypothetical protein
MHHNRAVSIWWWAFGYFACYVPYAALTKMVSSQLVETGGTPVGGVELLPPSVLASVVTVLVFLVATGWWRKAGRKTILGRAVPMPGRFTLLSGLCASGIIATTTLAYTFDGISIVFIMLLLRGGVLVMAPIVDLFSHRRVRWFSWVALALSIGSLLVATFAGDDGFSSGMTVIAAVDVACYLGFYFVRLSLMSHRAKAVDPDTNLRYFVEEQLVSVPALLLALAAGALFAGGEVGEQLRAGFTSFWSRPVVLHGIAIGVLSQGTGIFGGLILLDTRENTFSIPVNRASSILAGVVSSAFLAAAYGYRTIPPHELAGAALIVVAIGFLTLPSAFERRARTSNRQ